MNPPTAAQLEQFQFTVNGEARAVRAHPMERLLDVLRNHLSLAGTKEGCGEGECGACSILLDGVLVNSCLIPVAQVNGANITTIEGLHPGAQLNALQQAFLDCGGAQCGICTPGMILAAAHLLDKNSRPTLDDVREALAGNLCRCTGYTQIFNAVLAAADASRDGAS